MKDDTDFDRQADEQPTREIANVLKWGDTVLQPFSAGRQMALQRIKVISGSDIEAAASFVRLCLMTPEQVCTIRGEEAISKFHVDTADWMDREGVGMGTKKKERTQAMLDLYYGALNEIYDADTLEVEPLKDGKKAAAGNA